MTTPRIAITPGEPAGIGPDLLLALAQQPRQVEWVAVCDPELLNARARQLGLPITLRPFETDRQAPVLAAGELTVLPVPLRVPAEPGQLNPANAAYVLDTLRAAVSGCLNGRWHALATGPVHKGVINEAGIAFSGHTEFLAQETNTETVVMMLACEGLRVALATTHLPLAQVPAAITAERLRRVITVLDRDLKEKFGIARPRINVLGLNPHAGEGGHLGREEIEIITPLLEELRDAGHELLGPLPADTAFAPQLLANCDAVLAMYHDQGLPVLKYKGFGEAVNITLGLPIIRTSVDHGTALDLAGSGRADAGSLRCALDAAIKLVQRRG